MARNVVAAAISTRAPSAQLKAPMPVKTRSFEIGDWYQGRNRLPTITPQPITAIRSLPPRPRRSSSSWAGTERRLGERLAATVTALEVMPVVDLVLTDLPTQVHLPAVQER